MRDYKQQRKLKVASPIILTKQKPWYGLSYIFRPRHLFTGSPGWRFQLLSGTLAAFVQPVPSDLFLLSDYSKILQDLARTTSEAEYEAVCWRLERFRVGMPTMREGYLYSLELDDDERTDQTVILTGYTLED